VKILDQISLSLLVDIIDAGNLSSAARRLRMSRANVSYRLNQFERELGQQLLRRTTRRVEPTALGLRLYEHGRAIRDELVAARESVSLLGQSLSGRVRVSVPSGFGQIVMARWLVAFKRLYPDIAINVVFENRVEDLMRGEVDIAVRVMRDPPESLVARKLGDVNYVICASARYSAKHALPQNLAELRSAPVIAASVFINQFHLTANHGEGGAHELILEPTVSSENSMFLRECILQDLGIGIVPDYVVASEIASGEVVATLHDWRVTSLGTSMYMLYMSNRRRTRAETTFVDFIHEQALSVPPPALKKRKSTAAKT